MPRFALALAALALAGPALSAAPPPAGADNAPTVFPYPAKAAVVLCLNGYDTARERLAKVLAAGLPNEAPILRNLLDERLKRLTEGRSLAGVRKDGRIFVVVADVRDLTEPSTTESVLLPVASYREFRDAFLTADERKSLARAANGVESVTASFAGRERTLYVTELKGYVALTGVKEVADRYAAPYPQGSSELLGRDLADAFLAADLAVCVNVEVVNEQVGNQIRNFKRITELLLNQAADQGNLPGVTKKTLNAWKSALRALFQAIDDCRAVVVSAEFRPEGLLLRVQGRFAEGTATARLVGADPPDPLKDLGKLPTGFGTYTASRYGEAFRRIMDDLSEAFEPAVGDEGGHARLDACRKELAAAGFAGVSSATLSPGTAIEVTSYRDPAKAARALVDAYRTVGPDGSIRGTFLKGAPAVTEQARRHRGLTFTEVRVSFDLEATASRVPDGPFKEIVLEGLKTRFIPKTGVWIGAGEKAVVRLTAEDWDAAKGALDKYLDGQPSVGTDKGFQLTRRQLPAEATAVGLLEVRALVTGIAPSAAALAKVIPGAPKLPPITPGKGDPTYLGFATTLKGDTAGLTFFVPTEALRVAREMVAGWAALFK
jgi:hypothetical protein